MREQSKVQKAVESLFEALIEEDAMRIYSEMDWERQKDPKIRIRVSLWPRGQN